MHRDYQWIILVLLVSLSMPGIAGNDFKNTRVTIYNNDLGLVYQEKDVFLDKGLNTLRFAGVSKRVQPATVKLSLPKIAARFEINEQNYLYDLVNTKKLFDKYTGERVVFRLDSGETISGELLSSEQDYVVLRLPNEVIRILNVEKIIDYEFPKLPGGLILKPTLEWKINSQYKGNTTAQLSYLTGGMSWNAEYILVMNKNEKDFEMNSWISLDNHSGATFEDARVKLIAGDIHRAAKGSRERRMVAFAAAKSTAVEMREIADYYLYELPGQVTLRDNEMKQVTLFDEISGSGQKIYRFENRLSNEGTRSLEVLFKIANTAENNMGFAIPGGVVRVFQKDTDESLQFIGEDRIDHTSKKDTLKLTIGKAFDVKGKRQIIKKDRSVKNSETVTVRIKITNRKSNPVSVEVVEFLTNYWNIRKASHDYQKEPGNKIVFPIIVKADSSETITYTFTRKW